MPSPVRTGHRDFQFRHALWYHIVLIELFLSWELSTKSQQICGNALRGLDQAPISALQRESLLLRRAAPQMDFSPQHGPQRVWRKDADAAVGLF